MIGPLLTRTTRASPRRSFHRTSVTMVEGHQCHRVAHAHRQLLLGHAFAATSPNQRFVEGELLGACRLLLSLPAAAARSANTFCEVCAKWVPVPVRCVTVQAPQL